MALLKTVAVAANQARTVNEALQVALDEICAYTTWPVGHALLGVGDPPEELVSARTWHLDEPERFASFRAAAEALRFRRGVGLPGRVFDSGEPAWITDVTEDANFPRAAPAKAVGLGAGFAFPVFIQQEVVGVLEFFSTQAQPPDQALLHVIDQVGSQLGPVVERRRSEAALRASEERLRAVIETASDAFIGMDAEGRITDWNGQAEALLGWRRDDILGRLLAETIIPPQYRAAHAAGLKHFLATGEAPVLGRPVELSALHRDGHEVPMELTVWATRTGRGVSFSAFVNDITERRRAGELQAQLASLVQASDDAIVGLSPDCRITSWNPGAEALYGYGVAEVIGQHVAMLFAGGASANRHSVLERVAKGERIRNHETEFLRKDGSLVPVALSASPVLDDAGVVAAISSIARDITERRLADAAIRRAQDEAWASITALERHDREMTLINEMGALLQTCTGLEEAQGIIANFAEELFFEESGALYLLAPSRNFLEAAASWGTCPPNEAIVDPDRCWALRQGRIHVVAQAQARLACAHIEAMPPGGSMCVPMTAQGEVLGLLHLRRDAAGDGIEPRRQLAVAVAEHLALALSNFKLRETLRHQSIRDPLTGLYNRRYMEESLERELRRAARNLTPVAVIAIDVDHFKRFNDTFGHGAGDAVLRALGQCLLDHVRGADIACRSGGEELTLVLPDCSLDAARGLAERLRGTVRELAVAYPGPALGAVSMSLGVAAYPEHGLTPEELLRAADAALYQAKSAGRDRVVAVGESPASHLPAT